MKKSIFALLIPFIFGIVLAQGEELGQSHCTTESRINSPSFYDFNKMPVNQVTDKVGVRFVTSSHFTVIQWTLKKGANLPEHSHVNEQVTRIEQGRVELHSEGKTYQLSSGQVMIFPPYVNHEFIALTDVVIYELQTPIRQDFLKDDFISKLKDKLATLAENQ